MTNINILLLGGSKRISVGKTFIQAGKKLKCKVNLFAYELEKDEPIALIANIILGLKWKDKRIRQHLEDIIKKFNINIIIPFVDPGTILCVELKKRNNNIFVPQPNANLCKIFYDKKKTDDWARNNNIPIPEHNSKFPIIAKLRVSSGGKGNLVIKDKIELDNFNKKYEGKKYIIQEFIDAIEYSTDCYVTQDHKILSIVPRNRVETINGEATKSYTVKNESIIDLTESIITKFKLTGVLTIQYLVDKITEQIYLLEINPRFGSGIVTSIKAGANVPEMILKEFFGLENRKCINWKENLMMTRYFDEVYFLNKRLI